MPDVNLTRANAQGFDPRLFLRDEELDYGIALLLAGERALTKPAPALAAAHQMPLLAARVLIAIRFQPGQTVSQLRNQLDATTPTLARVLGDLDTRGLLERRRAGADGRTRWLSLTEAGLHLTDPVTQAKSSLEALVAAATTSAPCRIGIENPFAWELPVWLASGKIDGLFVLGDWLRLDKQVLTISESRMPPSFSIGESTQMGRYAERIYRHVLDAGIPLVPLAGGGDQSAANPIGYNRLYVTS